MKQHWPYLRYVPEAEAMLRRSVETGLSAGVFVLTDHSTDSLDSRDPVNFRDSESAPLSPDRLVSWVLMNLTGSLGYAHTMEECRRRGFARLALAELTRRCVDRQLPATLATGLDNPGMLAAMGPLQYTAVQEVFWATVTPPPTPTVAQATQQRDGHL